MTAAIQTDFDREACEFNFYLNDWNIDTLSGDHDTGVQILYQRSIEIPNKTNGWQTLEAEFTTQQIWQVAFYRLALNMYGILGENGDHFDLAAIQLEELPEDTVEAQEDVSGIVFRDGCGDMKMSIVSDEADVDTIAVATTAWRYQFDLVQNTIRVEHRVDGKCEIAEASFYV